MIKPAILVLSLSHNIYAPVHPKIPNKFPSTEEYRYVSPPNNKSTLEYNTTTTDDILQEVLEKSLKVISETLSQ